MGSFVIQTQSTGRGLQERMGDERLLASQEPRLFLPCAALHVTLSLHRAESRKWFQVSDLGQ